MESVLFRAIGGRSLLAETNLKQYQCIKKKNP